MADYYSVIATAVSRLPSQTDEARCAIYDRARTALQEALRDYEPPLLAKEQMALDEAIRTVEVTRKIDALMGFPPVPHVIVNSGLDRVHDPQHRYSFMRLSRSSRNSSGSSARSCIDSLTG
jgi:hypothetical protein